LTAMWAACKMRRRWSHTRYL